MDYSERLVWAGYGACAAIAFGSLGPWAVAGQVTASGVDEYGIYTLLMAIFAGFVLWRWSGLPKWEYLVGLSILAGICLAESAFFAFGADRILELPGVSPGWGLIATLAGSVALLAVAGLLYLRERS